MRGPSFWTGCAALIGRRMAYLSSAVARCPNAGPPKDRDKTCISQRHCAAVHTRYAAGCTVLEKIVRDQDTRAHSVHVEPSWPDLFRPSTSCFAATKAWMAATSA